MLHAISRIALAAVLSTGIAAVASAGSISDNTNVDVSQTVAGVGNFGQQDVSRIGNGGLFYGAGRGASLSKNTNVEIDQTVAGEFNTGLQSVHGVGNGGTLVQKPGFPVLRPLVLAPAR